jgi:hypothetical protein
MLLTDWRLANFDDLCRTAGRCRSAPHGAAEKGADRVPGRDTVGGAARALLRYANTEVVVEVEAPAGGILLLNDIWHPWWRADIDGAEVEILKADVIFRAVVCPRGRTCGAALVFHPFAGAFAEMFGKALSPAIAMMKPVIGTRGIGRRLGCGRQSLRFGCARQDATPNTLSRVHRDPSYAKRAHAGEDACGETQSPTGAMVANGPNAGRPMCTGVGDEAWAGSIRLRRDSSQSVALVQGNAPCDPLSTKILALRFVASRLSALHRPEFALAICRQTAQRLASPCRIDT